MGAVEHALRVLDALGAAPAGLVLREVAAAAGMSAPGAYRTLRTLVAAGMATQEGKRGSYRLGPKVILLARSMRSEAALVAACDPALRALSLGTGETAALAVLRDNRIWSIASVDGVGELVARPRLAHGDPYLHTTGRGKLYLAHMTREAARAVIAATGLPPVGPRTITDEATLWREVDRARERGYAVNREERSPGLGGVAFPVFDVDGRLVATVGITLPVFRFTAERERELVAAGRAAVAEMEQRLAGPGGLPQ